MRFFFVIAIVLFSWVNVPAQSTLNVRSDGKSPYHIRNFKSTEYGGFTQTWQCVQDERGIIHVASTSAIYSFDGIRWYGTNVRLGAATRQLYYDTTSSIVYVGSVSDFGCLEEDEKGHPVYRSFNDQLDSTQTIYTDVWKVHQRGEKIYFQSSERIFIVENKKVVGVIPPYDNASFALMFKCDERLFVRQRGVGLMEIVNDKLVLVENSEMFATTRLMGILSMGNNSMMLLTGDEGFIEMKSSAPGQTTFGNTFISDSFLTTTTVLGCEWLSDTEFGVCSRNGLMIYTRDFKPKILFDKKSGLMDESISEFYLDRERNIWITHNNGCSMISYYVPAVTYSDQCGFTGVPEVMVFVGDTMYLGTSEGLFRSNGPHVPGGDLRLERILDRQTEIWNIHYTGTSLLASTTEGVYECSDDKNSLITTRYTNQAVWLDSGRTVLTAEKGGFALLENNHGSWRNQVYFETPGIEFMRISDPTFINSDSTRFRFNGMTRFKTIAFVEANISDTSYVVREYGAANGLQPNDYYPIYLHDSVYYLSYLNAYRYKPELDRNDSSLCFLDAPDIFNELFEGNAKLDMKVFNYRLFLETKTSSYSTFFGDDNNGVYSRKAMLGELFAGENIQYCIIKDNELLWILNQQDVVQYNLNTPIDTTIPYSALITHVTFSGDSLGVFFPKTELTVSYSQNSVAFQFAAPYYVYNMRVEFQYQLMGYDTGWSKFGSASEKEYTNLHEGTYIFRVRAVNAFGIVSEQASFQFTILPPWYRTASAYIGYSLGFLLIIYFTIRLSARRLRKQKEKLEGIVRERTAEVVEQNRKIELQKIDLQEAYTGIQDSIQYSQRIQQAILPTPEEIKRIVPESFVLFFPRDIVSGDFYWFAEKGGLKYIACVDCTGHGVPGALMSMIGNTLLNQIILEKNISQPDEILNNLHVGVRQALKQDAGGDTRDGMDLALIVIDSSKNSLQYAGAYRALWIIRDGKLHETKADKFPIAGSQPEEVRRFTAHTVPLQKGDVIYLTTDGYADQFGGHRGKKFMVKQLTRTLADIHQKPLAEQQTILESAFFSWKGEQEQVDDVLIIGIRV